QAEDGIRDATVTGVQTCALPIWAMGDTILGELSPQFDQLYSKVGRPSIPPEHLLRALLLQVLYSVRSERLLMEQLDYNLLFRWRSEERRVGKESKSRWGVQHDKS